MQSVTTTACGRLDSTCICTATCPALVVLADVNILQGHMRQVTPAKTSKCTVACIAVLGCDRPENYYLISVVHSSTTAGLN